MHRLKPSFWWALSILLFAASAYFWNLGEKMREADQAKRQQQKISVAKPAPAALISTSATPLPVTKTNAAPPKHVDPSKYRVSNTTKSLAELQRDSNAILLRNALIDSSKPLDSLTTKIPEKWRAHGEPGSYIVQVGHALDKAFYDAVRAAGAEFVSYIPNNAALVKATAEVVKQLPYTAVPYEPYYKTDPYILTGRAETNEFFRFTGFRGTKDSMTQAITQAGGSVVAAEDMYFGPSLIAKIASSKVADIASATSVQAVEPAARRARLNDLTRETLHVAANSTTAPNYLGLTGEGITVNLNDSGADASHPDLTNRITGDFITSLIDFDGHGTHVAGIIAGDGSASTNVINAVGSIRQDNPPPNYFPNQFRGKAPKANLYVQSLDFFGGPIITDTYLQTNAASANTNVYISNNSWGYITGDPYSMATASYDAAVRDALPGTNGSQPMIYVFAAGNGGFGDDNGMNAFADTILSPAAGKNVITVGAVESLRNITNEIVYQDQFTNYVTNAIWEPMTDSATEVASFSSRGNVGVGVEGEFGRFKPDVVAPGVFIVSTRSTNWDDPTNFISADVQSFPGQTVAPGTTNTYNVFLPDDAIEIDVVTMPNIASPSPFPSLPIYADQGTNSPTTFRGNGSVAIPAPGGTTWTIGINDDTGTKVAYDVNIYIIRTNSFGDYFTKLKKLNDDLGSFYRYESGTSMAAPAVSGVLALMEEYFVKRLNLTPSPALMKALLINGARTLDSIYDFETRRSTANDQGWGLVNLPNSIPSDLGVSTGRTVFFDQSISNALATGQSQTWTVTPTALNSPMRITLVWTDPPGNPNAGTKLVNDLDLVVTNLETGEVFVGNHFETGDIYTRPDDPSFAEITPADTVNNVENVYLFGALGSPLGSNYTVTVRGSHVNVNAVTQHTNDVVQDYALVISGGARPTVATNSPITTPTKLVTVASNGVALLYQHVGANTPLLSTPGTGLTNGMISQWHFYVFTNNVDFTKTNATNVAFVTFLPPNLSQSRLEEPPGVAPRNEDFGADIDLYVSTNAALLDLDPNVMQAADKSTLRGGTEFVTYTNSFSNAVYYIGVKAEDQQAAEFGFMGLATDKPFGAQNDRGQLEINFTPLPLVIPDGFPNLPTRPPALAIGIVIPTSGKQTIRRVTFSQSFQHELLGDLYGKLTHNGISVVLNNHSAGSTTTGATNFVFTYDDNDEGDVTVNNPYPYPGHYENGVLVNPEWMHTDGPGSLKDFAGHRATGVWLYTMQDNALNHTGQVSSVQGWVDPNPDTNVLHQIRTIAGNGWFYDLLNIPDDATNLNINVSYVSGTGPVDIYLRKDFFPSPTNYDAAATNIVAPGGSLNINRTNSPPLSGGFWIYGIHNESGSPVTIAIDVTITRSLTPDLTQTITNKVGGTLLDDAITTSQIQITNPYTVVGVEVGLRLNHPRLSDLSIELISPQGTHVMLFEARGRDVATDLGLDTTGDPIYTIFTENTNKASSLIKFALPPYANITALTTNKVIASNTWDSFAEATYPAGTTVDGWDVLTNQVGIEFEPELNTSFPNYLALGSSAISRVLPTEAGKTYILTHTYHGPNIFDWWTADGNVKDVINTNNNGVFTNLDGTDPLYTAGKVGEAWHFDGTNTEVLINSNACNFGTNDFTVEFWMQTLETGMHAVMEKRPECGNNQNFWSIRSGVNAVDGNIGLEVSADGGANYFGVSSTNAINDGLWHHIALRRDEAELSVFVDGQLVGDGVAPDIAYISNSAPFTIGQSVCQGSDGTLPFKGNLDEVTVFQRSLAPAEIYDIYAAGRNGKRSTLSVLPNISYVIDGQTNDTLVCDVGNTNFVTGPGDAWQTNTLGFTATNNGTLFTIQGNAALGMLLDDVVLQELPNTNYHNYFLPEESLSAFNGEPASGTWTLEIHDARATNSGVLMDWELNFTYSSVNVDLVTVQPGVCTNVTVPAHSYAYFAVDVPQLAKFATNILNNTGPVPLDLLFNQNTLPTGYSDGDWYLMDQVGAGIWSATLAKNSGPPFLSPGNRYFLAVLNQHDADQPFCLQVDFDVNTNFSITSLDDPNPNPLPTNVLAGSVQYYYYDIETNSLVATFEILNPTADVDMVISHDIPLPDQYHYDYGSFNAGTNDEFIAVRTNSSPVALTPGRWYITVYNSITNPPDVTYTIRAQQSSVDVVLFPLVNATPYTGQIANPGFSLDALDELRFYTFTITNNDPAVEFLLNNLTGNCDLLARLGDWPTPSTFDFASFNVGTTDERLVITTNSSLPSLNGTWYLAIPNNDPGQVNFDITATLMGAGTLPHPLIRSSTAKFTRGVNSSFSFSFDSIAGQTYYIDMSTNLIDWSTVAKITATSSTTTFIDPNPADVGRYYRLRSPQ
jgi:subtilisin-like proprotein convertase family protein